MGTNKSLPLQKEFYPLRPLSSHQRTWLKLLRKIGSLLDSFQAAANGEPAYWYGERALTGLVSAAAWKLARGGSLEEFLSLRRQGRRKSGGKGDAWVFIGNRWYTIEAKVRWPRSASSSSIISATSDGIKEAKIQLSSLDKAYKEGTTKVAVCYIVPELELGAGRKPPSPKEWRDLFRNVQHELGESRVATACYLYKGKVPRYRDRKEKKTFIYPGLILVSTWWSRVH